jgi:hypothetical protein
MRMAARCCFTVRFFEIFSERLDIGGDVQRLDLVQGAELVMRAPGEETTGRMQIGGSRVLVADGHGEEFEEPFRRGVAGIGDDRRHHDGRGDGARKPRQLGGRDDGQFAARIRFGFRHGFRVT